MTRSSLRQTLDRGEFITAPGIHDMIAAVVANSVGFDFIYASGFWQVASAYGLPDAGIATYTEMLDRVTTLARTSNAAIIADADTGYGGLLNVHHTVQGFEAAGVTAIQLEDQEFPKKCGHTPNKRVIDKAAMIDKIQVACAARRDPVETLIIARTDAAQPEGFANAIDRAQAYAAAGADIIFVEALHTEDEMRTACAAINRPMLANMADGGKTPIFPAEKLRDIGYRLAIFPAMTSLAAAAAIEAALNNLKLTGTSVSSQVPLFSFDVFNQLIGFPEVWNLEAEWAARKASGND